MIIIYFLWAVTGYQIRFIPMKNYTRILILVFLSVCSIASFSQTSWKGTISTSWALATNWTNGVPTATTDAIIGDANFTGVNQPTISATAVCKSLTLGGAVTAALTINKTTTVSGNITINSNGTINNGAASLTLTGNWIKNGTYNGTTTTSSVIFAGTAQSIQGSSVTTFRKLTINAGSVTTLNNDVIVSGTSSICAVKGTLNPGESPSYKLTTTDITVSSNAVLKVMGAVFTDNYVISGTATLSAGSIVDYSATVLNQTVSSVYTYSTLNISGAGTKSLAANLPALNSSSSSTGKILVAAGIFDLSAYTANRGTTVAGGTVSVSNGATLKIGGTGTFPATYTTNTLSLTSTVEYNGTNQTISAKTYGNLKVSSSSGAATKTFPAAAFTIAGNFTSAVGLGSSVSSMAAANITVSGQVNIGASTTFNASSYTITVAGNWTNDGILVGGSSTITLTGAGSVISGAGTHNFNTLSITGSGITSSVANLSLSGNFSTSGSGTFTHSAGIFSMTGTTKTISGTNIILNNFTITGTISTASSLTVTGDINISGSFTQSAGTVLMNGSSKTITGGGTIILKTLQVTGSVVASTNFTIGTSLLVSGTFSATAGAATFTGSSTLSGTANLFDVTINGTSLILSASSVLGIANALTITAGTLNATTNIPNTVNFNGTVAQSINAVTFHHLILSNGNTKTAAGNVTVNGNLTISPSTTFNGSSYTHTISGDWINSGTFTAATSTVKFSGASNSSITGATTFYILTINKNSSSLVVNLQNNVTVPTINMTLGTVNTGTSTLTITTTRTGTGIILGTITRTHSFTTGTAYAFEGADNTITFTAVTGVTTITVYVAVGNVSDFPNSGAINRVYNITIPAGIYVATLRLHYEDAELNGNNETNMLLWQNTGASWGLSGKTANSTTSNYVEQSGLTNITNRWSCSDDAGVVRWNGSSSSNWATAANWTTVSGSPSSPPGANDIVQIGTAAFTNQPTISSSVTVKSISFGSAQAATLTIAAGGSLTTNGNINGTWSANATHTIAAGNQNLTVNGDLTLSDGTSGHVINLSAGANTITLNGSLTESGGANISFSGNTSMSIKNDFIYSSGTFTPGTGTVTYNGIGSQVAAAVSYNNLVINKASGIATINAASAVAGNFTLTAGEFDFNADAAITGNVSLAAATTLYGGGVTLNVGGNWTNSGTFNAGTGLVNFNGAGTQTISSGTFNNVTINKASNTAILTGNITLGSHLNIQSGTFDLSTYTANRNTSGGQFTLANGTTLLAGGSNNFPQNYTSNTVGSSSTVNYNGTGTQSVADISYGNLVFTNGGANAKTLSGSIDVAGNVTINSGATTAANTFTIALSGNWTNSGTFTPSTGTLILNGSGKTITGNTTFNKVTVNGSYTVAGSDIVYNDLLYVTASGSYAAGSGTATVNGDLTNSGILTSSGTTTFTGTTVQTIHLINALTSTSTGIVNFNGNVSPVLNSTSTPTFANLNINNTAGINPSVNWLIGVSMTVGSGGIFNGGISTHTILGSFTNNGTVTSSGTMNFAPASASTLKLSGTSFSSTGTVIFGGSGLVTITGTPASLNDVRITNTNAAGITPPSGWTTTGDFIINSDALFNAGSFTHTIGGDIESNGTLNGGTSTFIMSSSSGLLTGSPNTTFNHFTITGSIASNSDYNVAGNFTNNGTYDGSIGALIMTGSNAATIGGTTTPSTIDQLTIAKTSNAVVSLAGNISSVSSLFITSGILFTSTYSITQDAGGGILLISNGATLRLGGTNSLPGFSGYGLDVYSTVDYAGTTQNIGNAASYGNLMVSAAGNKNAVVPLIIQNDFTMTAGNLQSAITVTHTVGGNWTMSGGSWSNASNTILLNGTGDQYITSTGAFNNVTVNKPSGLVYLSGNITVNAILNLTAGKVSIGNYNLTMGNSGSFTGAGTNTYIIAIGTGTVNQQITAGSNKSFPVGTSGAYTPATIALMPGSTTDIFSLRMLEGAYTDGSTSGGHMTVNAVNATWLISEAITGGSNATLTVQWPGYLEMSGFNRSLSRLAHFYSGSWDYGTSDIAATGSNPYTVTRSGFTSFSPFSVSMFAALPVTWISVSGSHKNNDNFISWSTAAEVNNNYFIIEASADGIKFSEAGKVNADGNSANTQNYSFIDKNRNERVIYYRIRQVDIDGKFSYSQVVKISTGERLVSSILISPNPVADQANLILNAEKNSAVSIMITNINGQIIYTSKEKLAAGTNNIRLNLSDKASGVYILKLINDDGYNDVIRFIKK